MKIPAIVSVLSLAGMTIACSDSGGVPTAASPLPLGPSIVQGPLTSETPPIPVSFAAPEVFVGAGDIALCTGDGNHEATARLLDAIPGTVFTLGDNVYWSGTKREHDECYGPTWGRHRSRTRPVPGNHEYDSPGALPYFEYFGASAGLPGLGYYSFTLGGWHVIALNSNIPMSAGSAQGAWLRADLAAHPSRCTLAYWHHPRFSSGRHGNQGNTGALWQILYEAGAEVVMSGHDHTYERFAPQDADGLADPARGIRQFVVGTGGAKPYDFTAVQPNSEFRLSTHGVLKLTLSPTEYRWEFVSVNGISDAGAAACH